MHSGKIILIYKKSTLELHKEKHFISTLQGRNRELYTQLKKASDDHYRSVDLLVEKLAPIKDEVVVHCRGEGRMPRIGARDIVIPLGGDGTFIYTSHYVKSALMIGVNSAPDYSVGHYCAYNVYDNRFSIIDLIDTIRAGRQKPDVIHRLQYHINGKAQRVPIVNDMLICDANPGVTSRYILRDGGNHLVQKSSGIWISTAMGSSAAFHSAGGRIFTQFDKEGKRRYGVIIREPYGGKSDHFHTRLVSEDEPFAVVSSMIDGRIYIDGGQRKVPITVGDLVEVSFHEAQLNMILPQKKNTKK